ncbi:MAG: Ldh family oxidoreductase [Treponema sp.]|nr:Ldh family oxidoreductase [Treponema sp.]
MEAGDIRVRRGDLTAFCRSVFENRGMSPEEAEVTAEVLVSADAFGIPSHGVGRLRRYVSGLDTGLMLPRESGETVLESESSLVVDAKGAMGPPVSVRVMGTVIEKAEQTGAAFGAVRNSNHFGIAGYYARMALSRDMLGIAMTNTAALGVPTFGREAFFGTNPIAFAAPAGTEEPFVLDMSTTVVTRGKVEVYERRGDVLPEGWAVDRTGKSARDPGSLLSGMQERRGGGILPLGGLDTLLGGHKGYGLAVMVDILCALLSGGPFGRGVYDTPESSARVSHFFGAVRIDRFRDPVEFRADMDRMLRELRACPPAEGRDRVWYAGLPEAEHARETERRGVPLSRKTWEMLRELGAETGARLPSEMP